jgi:hypothetical protein
MSMGDAGSFGRQSQTEFASSEFDEVHPRGLLAPSSA